MTLDERRLIARFGEGDRQAFDVLFDRYSGRVMGFASRLTGNKADAEDLVQDTFLAAYAGHCSYQGRSSILTWLLGIAVRRWRDRQRRQTPEIVPFDETVEAQSQPLYSASEPVETWTINSLMVTDALNQLDPPFREALLLVASQGLTYREAADVLQEPIGTVKWRVSEAALRVRRILARAEDESNELHRTEPSEDTRAADR